ncbi:MAG: helix-turn-helix domain-containing protein [Planctomycetaceae bacterium]
MKTDKPKIVLTTGDVARLCGVSSRTVRMWIDTGLLPGQRVPGSSHRRVSRAALAAFMRENDWAEDLVRNIGGDGDED